MPMMPMMPVPQVSRVLHAITDHAAEDCSRRSGHDRACGRADRRSTGPAAMFRPVITECARGRQEKCSAEYGCSDSFMDEGCHHGPPAL